MGGGFGSFHGLHECFMGGMGGMGGTMGRFMASMVAPLPFVGGGYEASMGDGMGSYTIPNTTDIANEKVRHNVKMPLMTMEAMEALETMRHECRLQCGYI
jgi:hypothetical protein